MSKLKIPASFMLFGEHIEVIFDDDICDHTNSYGKTDPDKNRIILSKNIPDDKIEKVFFHEMMHYIIDNFNHDAKYIRREDEEFVVDIIARQLHQAVKSFIYY